MESICIDESYSLSDENGTQGRMKEDESKSWERRNTGDESECWRERKGGGR